MLIEVTLHNYIVFQYAEGLHLPECSLFWRCWPFNLGGVKVGKGSGTPDRIRIAIAW